MSDEIMKIERLKEALGWFNTTGSARKWWLSFEKENGDRPALVLKVLEELKKREASILEFFLAYVYSNVDNIQTNLDYLDIAIERARGERPLTADHFKNLST